MFHYSGYALKIPLESKVGALRDIIIITDDIRNKWYSLEHKNHLYVYPNSQHYGDFAEVNMEVDAVLNVIGDKLKAVNCKYELVVIVAITDYGD